MLPNGPVFHAHFFSSPGEFCMFSLILSLLCLGITPITLSGPRSWCRGLAIRLRLCPCYVSSMSTLRFYLRASGKTAVWMSQFMAWHHSSTLAGCEF